LADILNWSLQSKNLRRVAEQRLAEVQAEVEAAVAARQQPQRLPGPGGLSDLQVSHNLHQFSTRLT